MSYSDTKTLYRPIAEIVQEATNGGQLIVEFLVDTVLGKIEGVNHWHRLEATRQLQRLGLQLPNAVKQAASPSANGTTPSASSAKPRHNDDLADIIREETGDGRDIVRFLIDAMQGKLEGFKPRHRFAASDRLITRGFDTVPGHTVAACEHDDRFNAEDAPFDFENYTFDDFLRDREGERALFHIFGGEEARKAASKAYTAYRHAELDYDHSPIENPGDDPFGKGCYGYKVLAINYGDNVGIRIANKAALEFHREKHRHLLNEDGSISALADTSSLDPRTLQYLVRNRHLLAEKHQPQESLVGEGLRPSRDLEGPPTSATPSSSTTPDHPPAEHDSEHPNDTTVGEDVEPSPEYPRCQCRDCSETEPEGLKSKHPIDTTVEEDFGPSPKYEYCQDCSKYELKGFQPSRDPPHDTLNGAEGPPAPKPPPKKIRTIIHLGPPGEDEPPDDDSRPYRDPDEIRVPLRNLWSTTISLP